MSPEVGLGAARRVGGLNIFAVSQGFERQPTNQREEFLAIAFEPFHQGQRPLQAALSRGLFEANAPAPAVVRNAEAAHELLAASRNRGARL